MRKVSRVLLALLVAMAVMLPTEIALACGGCHGGGGGGGYAYGGRPMAMDGYGYGYGGRSLYGRGQYRWMGLWGRYPKRQFATPLRPWGGVAPLRQLTFPGGRGQVRRVNRRMSRRGF